MQELFSVAGKTALVTGGSRGIGLMIAEGLVRAGAKVYITSRKVDACEQACAQLSAIGECVALPCDLANMQQLQAFADDFKQREDSLDILVNNAGATWGAEIDDFPEKGWDRVMDLNVKSLFFLTQQLLPSLRAAARAEAPARVINIGSIDGINVGMFSALSYGASKAAVHHLTRVLAKQLVADHINVNAIAPGPFATEMLQPMLDHMGDAIVESNPMGRVGAMSDIAGTAIFLSSRASNFISGTVIPVDGGLVNMS